MKNERREQIIIILLLIIFSPLIIFGLIYGGLTTIFKIPKSRREYKKSEYLKDFSKPYYLGIDADVKYRFYNSAKARKLPIKYIKQKSNDFEYFIFDNIAYIFPEFDQISFSDEKNIWQVSFDGSPNDLASEYQKTLNLFDTPTEFQVKFLIERSMFAELNIENIHLPDCIYLTRSYEYAFKNDDIRLLAKLPQTSEELYKMMLITPNIVGGFELIEGSIHWQITEEICAEIAADNRDGYFSVSRKSLGFFEEGITHWHPSPYEIYNDVCKLGLKGHVLVTKGKAILYMGDKNSCQYLQNNRQIKNIKLYNIGE